MMLTNAHPSWPRIRETIAAFYRTEEWPEDLVETDLAWHRFACAEDPTARMPGRPTLVARWNWPDRKVRALLARVSSSGTGERREDARNVQRVQPVSSERPAGVQPVSSSGTGERREDARNVQPVSSERPAGVQPVSSEGGECPAGVQPMSSLGTGERREEARNVQPVSSECPALARADRSIPPSVSSTDLRDGWDRATLEPNPVLFERPVTDPVGARFQAVLRRWSAPTVPVAIRWRVDEVADVEWFAGVAAPRIAAGEDVIGALDRWDDWLRGEYQKRVADPDNRLYFPADWRGSVRKTLARGAAQPVPVVRKGKRRGTHGGADQRFDIPVVAGGGDEEALDEWR